MKKNFLYFSVIFIILVLSGCSNKVGEPSKEVVSKPFDKEQAVAKVLKEHQDFPKAGETINENVYFRGGPAHKTSSVQVTLSTKVEENEHKNYVVTLTKEWNINANTHKPVDYWKYEVCPQYIKLIENKREMPSIK